MNTLPPPVPHHPTPAAVSSEPPASYWHLHLTAAPEPLLLSRVLQKFAVPEIELLAVRFETGAGSDSQLELEFSARPERARLVAARLRKIIGVHGVGFRPLGWGAYTPRRYSATPLHRGDFGTRPRLIGTFWRIAGRWGMG